MFYVLNLEGILKVFVFFNWNSLRMLKFLKELFLKNQYKNEKEYIYSYKT